MMYLYCFSLHLFVVYVHLTFRVSLLGGFAFASGVYISCYTIKSTFAAFLLSYGILYGFGLGVAYTSPLVAALRWFPAHQGKP